MAETSLVSEWCSFQTSLEFQTDCVLNWNGKMCYFERAPSGGKYEGGHPF